MRENVRLQISRGGERLGALLTLVRSFTCVNANVPSQITGAHERFRAVLTLVRLLPCMRQNMALQVSELCKSTAADVASIGLLSRVNTVVDF